MRYVTLVFCVDHFMLDINEVSYEIKFFLFFVRLEGRKKLLKCRPLMEERLVGFRKDERIGFDIESVMVFQYAAQSGTQKW